MILNELYFWNKWTNELKLWLSNKFDSIDIDTSTLAKQGSNPSATNTAILSAIGDIEVSGEIPQEQFSQLAKEQTATANKQAILNAISEIDIDTTTLATKAQGETIINEVSSSSHGLSAIKSAVDTASQEATEQDIRDMFSPLPIKTITENGTYDVEGYGTAVVNTQGESHRLVHEDLTLRVPYCPELSNVDLVNALLNEALYDDIENILNQIDGFGYDTSIIAECYRTIDDVTEIVETTYVDARDSSQYSLNDIYGIIQDFWDEDNGYMYIRLAFPCASRDIIEEVTEEYDPVYFYYAFCGGKSPFEQGNLNPDYMRILNAYEL